MKLLGFSLSLRFTFSQFPGEPDQNVLYFFISRKEIGDLSMELISIVLQATITRPDFA